MCIWLWGRSSWFFFVWKTGGMKGRLYFRLTLPIPNWEEVLKCWNGTVEAIAPMPSTPKKGGEADPDCPIPKWSRVSPSHESESTSSSKSTNRRHQAYAQCPYSTLSFKEVPEPEEPNGLDTYICIFYLGIGASFLFSLNWEMDYLLKRRSRSPWIPSPGRRTWTSQKRYLSNKKSRTVSVFFP